MYAVPGPDPVSASIFAFLTGWQLGVTATNLTIGAINAFDRAAFEQDITAFNAMSGERQNKNRRERQAGGGEQSCPQPEAGGAGDKPPGGPPRNIADPDEDPLPREARDVLRQVQERGGRAPQGYRGGRVFRNEGRNGGDILPRADPAGRPITYREYDIRPHQPGVNRGAERIVVGSNGSAYYTGDHYITFIPIF